MLTEWSSPVGLAVAHHLGVLANAGWILHIWRLVGVRCTCIVPQRLGGIVSYHRTPPFQGTRAQFAVRRSAIKASLVVTLGARLRCIGTCFHCCIDTIGANLAVVTTPPTLAV